MIETTDVCAVTVTYGNRWSLLKKTVKAAVASSIGRIIIVDNGSEAESKLAITQMANDFDGLIEIVHLNENLGSAGGFKAGLEHAMTQSGFDYFWLLDDDNEANRETLPKLLKAYGEQFARSSKRHVAVQSFRPEIFGLLATRTRPVRQWSSTFLDFHVLFLFRNLKNYFTGILTAFHTDDRINSGIQQGDRVIDIPSGVYGGLFLDRSLVEKIGYPDDRLFLYIDDAEYTARIRHIGGRLFLVPASVLTDINPNAYTNLENGRISALSSIKRHFASGDVSRVYYWVRNQAYFERNLFSYKSNFNVFVYMMNKFLVMLILCGYTLRFRRMDRLRLIWNAVREGEQGILGKRLAFPGC